VTYYPIYLSPSMISFGFLVGLTSFGLILCLYLKLRSNSSLPLPPGPKKLPLIGNLLDLPKRPEWEIFQKWSKQYGTGPCPLSDVQYFFNNAFRFRYHPSQRRRNFNYYSKHHRGSCRSPRKKINNLFEQVQDFLHHLDILSLNLRRP